MSGNVRPLGIGMAIGDPVRFPVRRLMNCARIKAERVAMLVLMLSLALIFELMIRCGRMGLVVVGGVEVGGGVGW